MIMNARPCLLRLLLLAMLPAPALAAAAQGGPGAAGLPSARPGPGVDGGPPGLGPGGPGMVEERKVLGQFDKNGNRRLDTEERKEARASLAGQRAGGGPGGPPRVGPGGRRGGGEPVRPGERVAPADVRPVPGAPLYDPKVLRTLFLDFEESDWEQELEDFHNTDVEVPARLTVDGRTSHDVGVRFRGATSYMMVEAGRKRPLNISVDFVHDGQAVMGYRTLNLLNSHEDPSFLRTVLYFHIARAYLAAPMANFVRLVVNGESWGVYVNVQQFNKDFAGEWFGGKKGARWKVPGNPGGRGSLAYLGDDPAPYKQIYEIKSKDEPEAWRALIRLCKTLCQTPPGQLPEALAPMLDIDGALKFLALENALVNNDGYWIRSSDYNLYLDKEGRFHLVPYDANETFSGSGGPGGGPGGPGGPGFGPGGVLAMAMLDQGDADADGRLSAAEFAALGGTWWEALDPGPTARLDETRFAAQAGELLPPPPGFRAPGGARGPGRFIGPVLFGALDADHDAAVSEAEVKSAFARWFEQWGGPEDGSLDRDELVAGLDKALPRPAFPSPGGRAPGGPGGPGPGGPGMGGPGMGGPGMGGPGMGGPGMGGPGGPGMGGGTTLDPLAREDDESKPLISKLLAVPAFKARYLELVREIATTWLDWEKLGPLAKQYQALINDAVKADTRKLDSYAEFLAAVDGAGLTDKAPAPGGRPSLRSFAAQRRAFLLEATAPAGGEAQRAAGGKVGGEGGGEGGGGGTGSVPAG